MARRNLHENSIKLIMKQFLLLSALSLLSMTSTIAQSPCTAQELKGIHVNADSPCEASQGNTPYYNFVTLSTLRNNIKSGTLVWQYRQDTVAGSWQNLSPTIWQDLGTDVITRADFTIADNGQYRCIFTDTATGCRDFRKVNIYVYPRPQFFISTDSIRCEGMYLGVQLNNDPTQTLTYCWQPDLSGQTNNCQGDQPAFLFDRVGCMMVAGIVAVKVTNQYGCENMDYTSGLCNLEYMDLSTRVNDEDSVFCAKSAIVDVARVTNAPLQTGWTYQWKRNGNILSWATGSSIKPVSSGTYSCLVTNNYGCTLETNPAPVIVYPNPTVDLQPAGTTEICANNTLSLKSGSGNGNTYAWYRNNVLIPATADSLVANAAGAYKVIVSNAYGCSTISKTSKVTVYRATISATGPVVFCNGDSVVLQNNTNNTASWRWQLNSTTIPGATFPTYAAKQSGLYRVKTTSLAGCIAYSNQIDVNVNCRTDEISTALQITPVPASNYIDITYPSEILPGNELLLADANGRIIETRLSGETTSGRFDIQHLDAGIYFVIIQTSSGIYRGRFIKL